MQTVAEWADENRVLSSKASSEPGRWRTARTPFLKEIMDELSPTSPSKRIVFQKGAQIGGTECGNNWIGYVVDKAPGPMLMVQPTVEMSKRVAKQRLQPMIDACPALTQKISDATVAGQTSTTLVKEFEGGLLILTGSNSGAGLRSMPVRYLFCDEVDEYPGDVDDQGDPVALAEKRTTNFSRRKIFLVSTPTVKGASRIEAEFLLSDQRRYFVPCPHCGHMDWIRWANIRFSKDVPHNPRLLCEACGALSEERFKTRMLAEGEWRATAVGNGTIGFHLSSLYSPLGWKSWNECVEEWIGAQRDVMKLKTFTNTVLGETWELRGKTIKADDLRARKESYAAECPAKVGALTLSVDTQDDRLECKVKGWAADEESYLIAYHVIPGDPGGLTVWRELDDFRKLTYQHELGGKASIDVTIIDSGGHHTEKVYQYCASRERAIACRGGGLMGFVMPPTRGNSYRIPLFTLNTTAGKDLIFSRLEIGLPGPGYCHFPEWAEDEYFEQLTAEKAVPKWVKGRGTIREYIKVRDRNEALDLEVYSLAALYVLGPAFRKGLGTRVQRYVESKPSGPGPANPYGGIPTRPPPKGWVQSY